MAIETANGVLMKSDSVDILREIRLSEATVRKMKENLVWASAIMYLLVAIGLLYPNPQASGRSSVDVVVVYNCCRKCSPAEKG